MTLEEKIKERKEQALEKSLFGKVRELVQKAIRKREFLSLFYGCPALIFFQEGQAPDKLFDNRYSSLLRKEELFVGGGGYFLDIPSGTKFSYTKHVHLPLEFYPWENCEAASVQDLNSGQVLYSEKRVTGLNFFLPFVNKAYDGRKVVESYVPGVWEDRLHELLQGQNLDKVLQEYRDRLQQHLREKQKQKFGIE